MSKPAILRTDVSPRRALAPVPAPVAAAPARRLPAASQALLKVLPASSRALQLGDDDGGALADAYRRIHPACEWRLALDSRGTPSDGLSTVDLIVLGPGWQRAEDPGELLTRLASLGGPNCQLVVEMENQARLARVQQWVEGDLTEPDEGALAQRHLRHASPASLTKLLLDSGWMPALVATTPVPDPDARVLAAALLLAESAGTPAATARRTLCTERFVLQAVRSFAAAAPITTAGAGPGRFAVVVPTNRENQLRLNIEQSPGLREVGARVVARRHAATPAAALAAALPDIDADWVLQCHQDIYFPEGFGHRLQALLAGIAPADRPRTLIGFAGMGVDATRGTYENAGFVIDRGHRFDHPASQQAVSIDELAIVIARDSIHRIDPQMGWHLWATELCLAAICTHKVFAQIVRLPLFHNSVNDYRLPDEFHAAAQRLAAKYPDFGPIHTLCGVIPNPARPSPVAASSAVVAEDGRSAELPATDAAIDFALQAGDFNQALQLVVAGVHRHYRLPDATNRLLYYPGMDRRLEQLARRLADDHPLPPATAAPQGHLLIATELYALGGHTRVLADVAAELDRPTIVLTDLFRSIEQDAEPLAALQALFPHAEVQVLPPGNHWEKCQALRRLAASLNPHDIVHFAHHQDPIPFVATLHAAAPNQLFIHHGDHNPGLGCTLPGLRHVDLSDGVRDICAAHLDTPVATLPMHVEDGGVKHFAAASIAACSVVTSGHADKFARSGPLALQQIVLTTLRTIGGRHVHIGPLSDEWCGEIRAALAAGGVDPARFVSAGWVPSLWQHLKSLDASLCIGSAPLGGGRAAVEAQGCGYPVLYYADPAELALSTNHPMYAERALAWSTLEELAERLRDGVARHAAYSAAARGLYERAFSRDPFRRALAALLAPR